LFFPLLRRNHEEKMKAAKQHLQLTAVANLLRIKILDNVQALRAIM